MRQHEDIQTYSRRGPLRMMKIGTCVDCGVEKNIRARNRCSTHYNKWLKNNTERAWKKSNYPSDDELVAMASNHDRLRDLASELGIFRESLRDYLRIRPDLKNKVSEALNGNKIRIGETASRLKWRAKNPEKVRAINRKWAKNQDPANRARWNSYNRERRKNQGVVPMDEESLEFASIVRKDPCSYCRSYKDPTLDHIVPIELGGDSHWTNLAGACHSCNASKNDLPLLLYLLREANKYDTYMKLTSYKENQHG